MAGNAIPPTMSPQLLRKLHALAEQRCAYYIELHQSGRWRHYYTRDELLAQMRETVQIARSWQAMVAAAQDANVYIPSVPHVPTPTDVLEHSATTI